MTGSGATRTSGFTLIELLIVVVVIGVLASILIPNLLTSLDKGKQSATGALLQGIGKSLDIYRMDNGFYPEAGSASDLVSLLKPYSASLRPYDEWKNDLSYERLVDGYSLESFGKDGIDGPNISPATRNIFTLDIVYSDGQFTAFYE